MDTQYFASYSSMQSMTARQQARRWSPGVVRVLVPQHRVGVAHLNDVHHSVSSVHCKCSVKRSVASLGLGARESDVVPYGLGPILCARSMVVVELGIA